MYVVDLVAPGVVNTMPEKTLDAVADHGEVTGDTITGELRRRRRRSSTTSRRSASPTTTSSQLLEVEGVDKFEKAWGELLAEVTADLEKAAQKAAQR